METTRAAVEPSIFLSAEQLHIARRRYCAAVMFLLPILAFTFPGRPVQAGLSSDPLTLIKLATLASTLFGGIALFLLDRDSKRLIRRLLVLLPFFGFLAWAILSVLWSPLRGVTLNQAGGLTALLLFTLHLACVAEKPDEASWLLKQLCHSLLLYSSVVFVAFLINPSFSGLDRSVLWENEDGLIHPTASGSTAALGLVVTTLCWLSGRFSWSARLLFPAMLVHGPTVYYSHSRSSLAMAVVVIFLAAFYFGGRLTRGGLAILVVLVAVSMIAVDPGLHQLAGDNAIVGYLFRGQDLQELAEGSGRAEMWQTIWDDFQNSGALLRGHGYFVTSQKGELYVWYHYANHTAHNLFLQVLVTTGVIGLALWSAAQCRIAVCLLGMIKRDDFRRTYLAIVVLTMVWFAGWSVGSTSFMGPVRSESVVWFSLIGIGIGLATAPTGTSSPKKRRQLWLL
ncbi:MAG: O-antigen ligase family protein [Planctomycetota bacterium]